MCYRPTSFNVEPLNSEPESPIGLDSIQQKQKKNQNHLAHKIKTLEQKSLQTQALRQTPTPTTQAVTVFTLKLKR